ncbi:PilZ domain-containing protein [Pseudobacteriovorax antillogorgiicola]|uniref:PilZ domain-containing protein n=1 Tax=Pseudobacteriovorax antillogorgiicola TaxID=1513793 RepID=A0A1Y6CM98_9BACT|nr:PilZ domain-containing protein [Pseudobacteriovorax antillogorgiicola]TCS47291.1 PilZ domain-containing protein [Pseudobacteriovorax antillogorgiicola]SMF62392.1 PilZ domain-containing protein [Pseudobacteriovorax antillogorgiicola]
MASKPAKKNDWMTQKDQDDRVEKRRSLYLGERVLCDVRYRGQAYKTEVVDISTHGVALISISKDKPLELPVGAELKMEFRRRTPICTVEGTVANTGYLTVQGKKKARVGVQFKLKHYERMSDFTAALGEKLFLCKTYIRPQISCYDTFFYKEVILFQVNGFTSQGIDVVTSARWKSILPGQSLKLNVFIPGKGAFEAICRNSEHYYHSPWKGRFRLFLRYENVTRKFLEAVSEYIIMMNPKITPNILRDNGFSIGVLEHACHLERTEYSPHNFPGHRFSPSVLGAGSDDIPLGDERIQAVARDICCKLGPHPVAFFNLAFFNGIISLDQIHPLQKEFSRDILANRHVVLTNLLIGDDANLPDFLIPMLQHVTRITAQSKSKFLILEAEQGIVKILKHIGFQTLKSIAQADGSEDRKLLSLEVNAVLGNKQLALDTQVWSKVYQSLNQFLGRAEPQRSQVRPFQFPNKS